MNPADELVERLRRIADQMERFLGPPEMAPGPDPDDLTDAVDLIEAQAAEISSLRENLRQERDLRLNEVRLKERYRTEISSLRAQVVSLQKELAERTAERDAARAEIERMTPQFVAYEYLEAPDRREAAESRVDTLARRVERLEAALKAAAYKLLADQYDLLFAEKIEKNSWRWPDDSPTVVHGTIAQILAALTGERP
jgi:chromosome segregation ATPase